MYRLDMNYANSKGVSKRKGLEQVWKQTGTMPIELQEPDIPLIGVDLYNIFWDVFDSEKGITWEELYYYGMYTGVILDGEEVKILKEISVKALHWLNTKRMEKTKTTKK